MSKLSEAPYRIAVTLWVGGLWAIGGIAAPALFYRIADRTLAGSVAGQMFVLVAWSGMACAAYLLLFLVVRRGVGVLKSGAFWLVLMMLALTLAGHFGIQPILAQLKVDALPRQIMESALRDRFAAWHGVSSALYLIESLLGLVLALSQEQALRRY
jgi:hypothetical protein